jgi:SAM-dependent methyltransferase
MFENSDKEWEIFGERNPYYGVITQDKFQGRNLGEDVKAEFWQSGQDYVDAVFHRIRNLVDPDFRPENALDFGCGVGRLLFAISARCSHATGIDVSPSMLEEAKREAGKKQIANVAFIESGSCDGLGVGLFDFVHSYIVFQHIPVDRGYVILDKLLASLRSGGVGVLHFTFSNQDYRVWKVISKIPFSKQLRNLVHGRPLNTPFMQMNEYDLNRIMEKIRQQGVNTCHLEFTDHGVGGVVVYFKKT